MDKLEALYNSYIEAGLLSSSTTLDQFALANDNIINALYQQGIDNNILSKSTSIDLFKSAWTEKKSPDTTIQLSQEDLDLPLEGTSLGSPQLNAELPMQPSDRRTRGVDEVQEEEIKDFYVSYNPAGIPTYTPSKENPTYLEQALGKWSITDFLGDIYRAAKTGYYQGRVAGQASDIFFDGKANVDKEAIQEYVNAAKQLRDAPVSDEMVDFTETVQENGGGVKGFIFGLLKNPSVAPQVVVSSMVGMFNQAGAAGAAVGGAAGSAIPILGTTTGAIAGATLGTETALSFSEFIQEELDKQNMELTTENVEAIFQDPEAMKRIRGRALARGLTIAVIDAVTAKMGGRVIKEGVRTGKRAKAVTKSLGIEATGGGAGEAGARGLAGQEMDVAEIGLEAVSPGVITGVNVAKSVIKPPKYTVNGQNVEGNDVMNFLDTATDEQILESNITVTNDQAFSEEVDQRIREAKAGLDLKNEYGLNYTKLDETQANKLVSIEAELARLGAKSFKTVLTKKKIKSLETQLDKLSKEYGLLEEVTEEVTPEAAPEVAEEVTQVEYTAPETRKQRRAEHELISIKEAEKRGLEVVEGQKWVAINKLTGRVVYAKSKGEAQSAIDNMDYDFGEGDLVNKKDLDELRGVKPEVTPIDDSPVFDTKGEPDAEPLAFEGEEVVEQFTGVPLIPIVPDQVVPSVLEALPESLKAEFMLKQKNTSPTSALRDILKRLPEETRNKISNDIKNKISEVDIAEKKDRGLVSRDIDGNKFDNIDPNTNEPTAVELEDGVIIVRNEDGTYTDGDSVYESFSALMEQQKGMDMTSPTVFTEQNQRQSIVGEVEVEVAPEVTEEVVVQELPENVPFRSDKQKGIIQDLLNENYTSENLASDFEAGRIKVGKDGKLTRESVKQIAALSKTEPVETAKTLDEGELVSLFEQALDARFQVKEGVPMDQADQAIYEGLRSDGMTKITNKEIKSKEDINDFLAETIEGGKKFSDLANESPDKILDTLADIKKQLDQFGLAAGLTPRLLKPIVSAIEAGVKAGRALKEVVNSTAKKFNVNPKNIFKALGDFYDRKKADFQQFIVNKYIKPFRMQEAVEKIKDINLDKDFKTAMTLLPGKVQEMLKASSSRIETMVSDLSKSFPNAEVALQKLDDYLYALHAEERNKYIIENVKDRRNESLAPSGMYTNVEDVNADLEAGILTEEQAKDIIDNGQTAQQIIESFNAKEIEALRKARRVVRTVLKESLDTQRDQGLITEKEYQTIIDNPYNEYVPLTNFDSSEDIEVQVLQGYEPTRRIPIRGKEIKAAKGRTSKAGSITANILQQVQRRILRQEKNATLQKLYKFMEDNPDPENYRVIPAARKGSKAEQSLAQRARDGQIVPVKIDGKYAYMEFTDPSIAKVFTDTPNILLTSNVGRALIKANSFLRGVYTTYSPEFLLVNNVRDVQTAILNALAETDIEIENKTEFIANMIKDDAAGIKNIYKIEMSDPKALLEMTERQLRRKGIDKGMLKDYLEFKKLGGSTGYINQKSYEQITADLTKNLNKKNLKDRVVSKKSVSQFVDAIGNASENATRLAGFRAAKKAGLSPEKAAALAKNLTVNFNQRGTGSEFVNALYLFFNAATQGTANFVKAILTTKKTYDKEGKKIKSTFNPTQKIAMGMVLGGFLLNRANRGISEEDEDGVLFYDKIPWYEKERNLIVMKPDGKGYFKFPLPYGYNVIYNMGDILADVGFKDKSPGEAVSDFTTSFIGAFSPVNVAKGETPIGGLAKTAIPTAVKPIVEVNIGTSRYGTPIFAPKFGQDIPDSQVAKTSTSEEAKSFVKFVNELTGGTTQKKGTVDMSPETIPYLVDEYFGTIGRLVQGGAESIADFDRGLEKDVEEKDKPIIRRFSGEVSRYKDVIDMYDRMNAVEINIKELKDIAEGKERKELLEKDREIYRRAQSLSSRIKADKKTLKAIRDRKKYEKQRRLKGEITYQQEYDILKRLEKREDEIADRFNKRFLTLFSKSSLQDFNKQNLKLKDKPN